MNDASVKAILAALVEEIEHLRASLEVVSGIAGHQKGISAGKAADAVSLAKSSSKKHYDKLRKAINEISS